MSILTWIKQKFSKPDMLSELEALAKSMEAGGFNSAPSGFSQGQVLQVEEWSYRYTQRGNLWLLRHKITGQIMEPWCSDSDGYDGYLVNAFTGKIVGDTMVVWDYDECEVYAVHWDNRPEFKDSRRGVMDLITYDESMLKKVK